MDEKPLKEEIIENIRHGSVRMSPKWHFILKNVLLIIATLFVLFGLLTLVSFIFFAIRQSGIGFAPAYGSQGILVFLKYLPWILILVSLLFIIVLEFFLKQYHFTYRKPLLYSLLIIFLISVVGGIAAAPLHQAVFSRAQREEIPFAGSFYRDYGARRLDEINRGQVTALLTSGLSMTNEFGENLNVILPSQILTRLANDFEPGDKIIVFGKKSSPSSTDVWAYGIRKIE